MKTLLSLLLTLLTVAPAAAQAPPAEKKLQPPTAIDWRSSVDDHHGFVGEYLLFACPREDDSARGSVWGSDAYTTDSAICPAAVHAGRITAEEGGTVTLHVVSGRDAYTGSTRHGVESLDYDDAWESSFVFVDRPEASGKKSPPELRWTTTAQALAARQGEGGTLQTLTFHCPPGGTPEKVWGTDVYTTDSSICSAAVHAGKITAAEGGRVTLTLGGGQESYPGSERHGVVSESFGAWEHSFTLH